MKIIRNTIVFAAGIYVGQEFIDVPPMRNVARKLYTDMSVYMNSLKDSTEPRNRSSDPECTDRDGTSSLGCKASDPECKQNTVSETIDSVKKQANHWFWGTRK